LGTANLAVDPLLIDPAAGDFRVDRASQALRAGPGGTDIGAVQTPHYTPANAANLRITEIHYHPLPANTATGEIVGNGEFFEFIELKSTSAEPIDLTDVAFDDGIDFTFPWLATLGPDQVVILAKNIDLFTSRYGAGATIIGPYAGSLSSAGEHLRLRDASGGVIADLTYDDAAPWPTSADGGGPSLEAIGLTGSPGNPANWRASSVIGGTPGFVGGEPTADFDADADVDGADFLTWQRHVGATGAPHSHGDANGDGAITALDLAAWRSEFGAAALGEMLAASAVVAVRLNGESVATNLDESRSAELIDAAAARSGFDVKPPTLRPRSRPLARVSAETPSPMMPDVALAAPGIGQPSAVLRTSAKREAGRRETLVVDLAMTDLS
jgi:hypothetical protein